jgi:glycosyltransferase involved in cell wall biosynthesis
LRVCFLTHYFPPEAGAPQTRIDLLARTLAARGASVTVHTGFPHYPSGVIPAPYRNRPWTVEHRDGITIIRSAVYPAANRGFTRRLADHGSLALSALATAPLSGRADVVVGETPPLFTAAAGVAYAAAKRAAYVVNVADRWPASAVALGALRNRQAIALASALERFTYAGADLIVAPTQGIVDALAGEPRVAGKTRRLWPVVDIERFDPSPPPGRAGAPLSLLYAGTLGLAQGLDILVRASKLAGPRVVQTTIAGDGADAERLRDLLRDEAVTNVKMLGALDAEAVPGLYTTADAAAVLLRDLPIFAGALPTKLLEAMAAGRPLVLSARGESADLVTAAGAGVVVAPGDPAALAEALVGLQGDPPRRAALGRAGRDYAETHFGAARAADAWTEQLSAAVRARGGARQSAQAAAGRYRAD